MTVVAMSIETGAIEPCFSLRLAERLRAELVDLRFYDQRLARAPVRSCGAIPSPDLADASYRALAFRLREAALLAARDDRTLVVGTLATAALGALPAVLRVSVCAPQATRTSRYLRDLGYRDARAARDAMSNSDALTRIGLELISGAAASAPARTDLSLSTERLDGETCIDLISGLVRRQPARAAGLRSDADALLAALLAEEAERRPVAPPGRHGQHAIDIADDLEAIALAERCLHGHALED